MGCRRRSHTLPVPSVPTPQRRAAASPRPVPAARKQPSPSPPPPARQGTRLRARPTDNGNRSARGGEGRAGGRRAALPRRPNSPSRLSDGGLRAARRSRGAQFRPAPSYPPAGHSPVLQRAPDPARGGSGETRLGPGAGGVGGGGAEKCRRESAPVAPAERSSGGDRRGSGGRCERRAACRRRYPPPARTSEGSAGRRRRLCRCERRRGEEGPQQLRGCKQKVT